MGLISKAAERLRFRKPKKEQPTEKNCDKILLFKEKHSELFLLAEACADAEKMESTLASLAPLLTDEELKAFQERVKCTKEIVRTSQIVVESHDLLRESLLEDVECRPANTGTEAVAEWLAAGIERAKDENVPDGELAKARAVLKKMQVKSKREKLTAALTKNQSMWLSRRSCEAQDQHVAQEQHVSHDDRKRLREYVLSLEEEASADEAAVNNEEYNVILTTPNGNRFLWRPSEEDVLPEIDPSNGEGCWTVDRESDSSSSSDELAQLATAESDSLQLETSDPSPLPRPRAKSEQKKRKKRRQRNSGTHCLGKRGSCPEIIGAPQEADQDEVASASISSGIQSSNSRGSCPDIIGIQQEADEDEVASASISSGIQSSNTRGSCPEIIGVQQEADEDEVASASINSGIHSPNTRGSCLDIIGVQQKADEDEVPAAAKRNTTRKAAAASCSSVNSGSQSPSKRGSCPEIIGVPQEADEDGVASASISSGIRSPNTRGSCPEIIGIQQEADGDGVASVAKRNITRKLAPAGKLRAKMKNAKGPRRGRQSDIPAYSISDP